jgi:hypothetical protein
MCFVLWGNTFTTLHVLSYNYTCVLVNFSLSLSLSLSLSPYSYYYSYSPWATLQNVSSINTKCEGDSFCK